MLEEVPFPLPDPPFFPDLPLPEDTPECPLEGANQPSSFHPFVAQKPPA